MTIPAAMLMNAALDKFKSAKIEGDILAGAKVGRIRLLNRWIVCAERRRPSVRVAEVTFRIGLLLAFLVGLAC